MRFSTLDEWLSWQETLHPESIELGLERISRVFKRLHAEEKPFPVITVAGTNGKGSSVAMLEEIYRQASYNTGTYTSPHLLRYNERIRFNNKEIDDAALCESFARIDNAREETSLTYFEFGTLAALDIFYRNPPDIVILEVGLGGRLDAVNIIDADVALITSIGIDHTAWLGEDIESIAKEKAGIMRQGKPAIFSGLNLPENISNVARQVNANLLIQGRDFHYSTGVAQQSWDWQSATAQRAALPLPNLQGEHQLQNAAGVLMAVQCMSSQLPVNQQQVKSALLAVTVAGRFECIPGEPTHIFDVAHNTNSMEVLAKMLQTTRQGRTYGVLGMLDDKAHQEALAMMVPEIDAWYLADLQGPRACTAEKLKSVLLQIQDKQQIQCFTNVKDAIMAADREANPADRVVVFGSFHTVANAVA